MTKDLEKATVDELLDYIRQDAQHVVNMCDCRVNWQGTKAGRDTFWILMDRLKRTAEELFGESWKE